MVSAFLLIYYTDVAGISAATAGTLFLVARVWGGFTDLFAGHRVDATSTRWGRFRPYLLFGSRAAARAARRGVLDPERAERRRARSSGRSSSYALFQLAYSFVNIPYGSLSAAMTQEPGRTIASFVRRQVVAASLTILLIAVVVSPQISGSGDLQRSLTITTIVFAVVGLALYLWCFATTRETVERSAEQSERARDRAAWCATTGR